MITTRFQNLKNIACLAACVALSLSAFADNTVYNNTTTFSGSYYPSSTEFGDQVFPVVGTNTVITAFSFEYFASLGATPGRAGVANIYMNDGTSGSPGTQLYTSPSFSLANGYNTISISGINLPLTPSFTWSVLFTGLQPGDAAGLSLYDPPTVGTSNNDFWQKDASGAWALKQINGGSPKANFGAKFFAVPEPSPFQLLLVGGLMIVGYLSFRRYSCKLS